MHTVIELGQKKNELTPRDMLSPFIHPNQVLLLHLNTKSTKAKAYQK